MSDEFKVVVAAILQKEGKILLVQEGAEHKYGKWNFPGGCLNAFESFQDGLKREILEETGFESKPGKLFQIIRHKSLKNKDITLFLFHAEIIGGDGQTQDSEILSWKWATPKEALSASDLLYPHLKECISRLVLTHPPLILDLF